MGQRHPKPDGKLSESICKAVEQQDMTLHAACKAAGFPEETFRTWLYIAQHGKDHKNNPSEDYLERCRKVSLMYARACEIQKERRIDRCLENIVKSANEGHPEQEVTDEEIPARVETTTKHLKDGTKLVTTKEIPAYRKKTARVKKAAPDWRAGVEFVKLAAPERFNVNRVKVEGGPLLLQPGEPEAVISEATDEEMVAIDGGDVKVLAKVVARIRQKENG